MGSKMLTQSGGITILELIYDYVKGKTRMIFLQKITSFWGVETSFVGKALQSYPDCFLIPFIY